MTYGFTSLYHKYYNNHVRAGKTWIFGGSRRPGGGGVDMKRFIPAFQLLGIGFYIAVCVGGGLLGGWWLGGKRPVFSIIGLVIGLVLAFCGAYIMIKPLLNNKNNKEND
jgi:hypothetical protein